MWAGRGIPIFTGINILSLLGSLLLVFSREERWSVTWVLARIVGSFGIMILSFENLLSALPCLLWRNHYVPFHSSSISGFGSFNYLQDRRHFLRSVQFPRGCKRKRLQSARSSRNSRQVFHQALGGRCWFGHLRDEARSSLLLSYAS
jgi:hypothetical protein